MLPDVAFSNKNEHKQAKKELLQMQLKGKSHKHI